MKMSIQSPTGQQPWNKGKLVCQIAETGRTSADLATVSTDEVLAMAGFNIPE